MGIFDFLGGGGGGGGATTQQFPTLQPGQQDFLDQLLSGLGGLTGAGLTPTGPQQFAGISPFQQQAFDAFGGLAGLGQQGLGIAQQGLAGFDPSIGQGFLGPAQGALSEGLQGFDPERILSALEPGRQLALNQFNQQVTPDILERFGTGSGASGSLNKALAEAGANLSLGLNAQAAPFLGQAALQAPGQQFAGAGLAGNLAQLPGQLAGQSLGFGAAGSDLLGQLLNVGGLQRGIAQEPLTAQFQAAQQPSQLLSQFGGLALGTPGFGTIIQPGGGQSAAQSGLPGLGSFIGGQSGGFLGGGEGGGFLGGASPTGGTGGDIQLALQLAAMFSDERVKENIEPIENALEKVEQLNGVMFDYTEAVESDGNRHGGIIAQDLEKVLPDAVIEVDGIKKVDMNAVIGLLVEAVKELSGKVG
jgi:hypothetical protein